MIVLNYHTVREGVERDFYTVSPNGLESHLAVLAARGVPIVTVDALFSANLPREAVMLNFDDGTEEHASIVAPLLEKYGMRGVFFISTGKIDEPGYLTRNQVSEMARRGHSIECHGHSHQRMDTMAGDRLQNELKCSAAEIFRFTGRAPRIIAPPGGYTSKSVETAAAELGMEMIRTMCWGTNCVPVKSRLNCIVIHGGTSAEQVERWLDGKGLFALRLQYRVKEAIRSCVPLNWYLKMRRFAKGE